MFDKAHPAGYNLTMYNFNRGKQSSYSIFLTREQTEALSEMLQEINNLNITVQVASIRVEVKRKVRVLLDAIRKRESRPDGKAHV